MINEDLKSRTKINQEPDYLHSKYEHLNGDFKGNEPSIDIVQEENQKFGYNSQKKRNNLNSLGENKSNFIQKIESNSNYNFINLDDYLPHYSDIFNLFQHYFQGNSSNFNILNSNSAKILLNIFSGHELFHFLAKYASLYSIKLYKINILSIFTDNIDENLLKLKNELLDLSTARKNCKIIIIIPLEHYNKLFNSFPAAYLKIFEILRSIFLYKDQILLFLQKNDSDSRLPIENTSFFDFSLNIRLPNTEDQKKYICIFAQEMKLEDHPEIIREKLKGLNKNHFGYGLFGNKK